MNDLSEPSIHETVWRLPIPRFPQARCPQMDNAEPLAKRRKADRLRVVCDRRRGALSLLVYDMTPLTPQFTHPSTVGALHSLIGAADDG